MSKISKRRFQDDLLKSLILILGGLAFSAPSQAALFQALDKGQVAKPVSSSKTVNPSIQTVSASDSEDDGNDEQDADKNNADDDSKSDEASSTNNTPNDNDSDDGDDENSGINNSSDDSNADENSAVEKNNPNND